MTLTNVEGGLDAAREAQAFNQRAGIARLLETTPDKVRDARSSIGGNRHFDYFFVEHPSGPLFVKEAPQETLNKNIEREALATQLAGQLGIPCKKVHTFNTTEGSRPWGRREDKSLVALELFDAQDWDFFGTPEQIAGLDTSQINALSKAAVTCVRKLSENPIPLSLDISVLHSNNPYDQRYVSLDGVAHEWQLTDSVLEQLGNVFEHDIEEKHHRFSELRAEAEESVRDLVSRSPATIERYFVHADLAPNNFCIDPKRAPEDSWRALDFEHAASTRHKTLARLADFSNFFGRCWPNPELQKKVAQEALQIGSEELSLDDRKRFARAAVIFGTFFLAKYGMDPEHEAHNMTTALLHNLEANLLGIDQAYTATAQ